MCLGLIASWGEEVRLILEYFEGNGWQEGDIVSLCLRL